MSASSTATPASSSKYVLDDGTWTRRRGTTAEQRLDSDSGTDLDDEDADQPPNLSPLDSVLDRVQVQPSGDTNKANSAFVAVLGDAPSTSSSSSSLRPRNQHLSKAADLPRSFETHVSMTPPARFGTHNDSPFTSFAPGLPVAPVTEVKRQQRNGSNIPRSRAFGPFAPLDSLDAGQGIEEEEHSLADVGTSMMGHWRAKTDGEAEKRKRGQVPTFLNLNKERQRGVTMGSTSQMDIDSENDDLPPPSPSPMGDLAFPRQSDSGASSEDDEVDEMMLKPGARTPATAFKRMGGSRSKSAFLPQEQQLQLTSQLPGLGGEVPVRSLTTSSIRTSSSSSSVGSNLTIAASPSNASSLGQQQTKTPIKRRAGNSSSGSRSRVPSTSSPVQDMWAQGRDMSDERIAGTATLFGFAGQPSSSPARQTSRENKRRSTGSLHPTPPGSRLFARDASSPPQVKRNSLTPSAPNLALLRRHLDSTPQERDNSDSPRSELGFDDSGVAFDTPGPSKDAAPQSAAAVERLLGKRLGLKGTLSRKSPSLDSLSSPSKEAAMRQSQRHPFSVKERSALANETRLSDAGSSAASSPDFLRRAGKTSSVPEGLASPARHISQGRSSASASSLAVAEASAPYMTPQTYKNVKPLQTAFMSTGLVSKRNRPSLAPGTVDPATGETVPPLPPKPNFNPTMPSQSALGLREVVAAANAQKELAGASHTMPDTPIKRPGFPATLGVTPAARSPLASISPAHDSVGSNSGGEESPPLGDSCDSPTLNLVSMSASPWGPAYRARSRSPFSIAATQDGFASHGATEPQDSQAPSPLQGSAFRKGKTRSSTSQLKSGGKSPKADSKSPSPSSSRRLAPDTLSRPMPLRTKSNNSNNQQRPALGLQRKSSFGPLSNGEPHALPLQLINSPTFGCDFIPSTPTRNSTNIKWFEATQIVTTPSPSSRRQSAEVHAARRSSWQSNTSKLRHGSQESTPVSKPVRPSLMKFAVTKASYFETKFTVISVLGSGEFSEAVKVEDKETHNVYAVKRMKKPLAGTRDRLRRLEEVDVLRHLGRDGGHPHIISLADAWEESFHLYVQTELCSLGTLSFFLNYYGEHEGQLDEPRLWKIFAELASGVAHIHSNGVIHLDLKPANIFITEIGSLKIGDFGMATRWPRQSSEAIIEGAAVELSGPLDEVLPTAKSLEREGDREYLAPEVMFKGRYDRPADIFSLGLVMLEAAGNVFLPDNGEPWQKLRSDDLSDVDLSQYSVSLVRLIRACLNPDPTKRPTIEAILAHPVFSAVKARVEMGLQTWELDQLPNADNFFGNDSSDAEMTDSEDHGDEYEVVPKTPTAPMMERGSSGTSSKSSTSSALGLSGVPGEQVCKFRGALIQETDDFLREILAYEPDVEARQLFHHSLPTIKIVGLGFEHDDNDRHHHPMDLDQDDEVEDVFVP